jgi:hypothetical protein
MVSNHISDITHTLTVIRDCMDSHNLIWRYILLTLLPNLLQTVWMWYFLLQHIYNLCPRTFSCRINQIVIVGNGMKVWLFSSAKLSVLYLTFFSVCRTTLFIVGSVWLHVLSHFCMSHFNCFMLVHFVILWSELVHWSLTLLLRAEGDSVIIVLQTT